MIIRKLFLINILFVANTYSMHTPPRIPRELVVPGAPVRPPRIENAPVLPAHLAGPINFNPIVPVALVPPALPVWMPLAVHGVPPASHIASVLSQLNLGSEDNDESMD